MPETDGIRATERILATLNGGGLTDAEIAGRLPVGPATAKTHVAAVLAETGARDRTQAVIAAYEAGFVTPDRAAGRAPGPADHLRNQ